MDGGGEFFWGCFGGISGGISGLVFKFWWSWT